MRAYTSSIDINEILYESFYRQSTFVMCIFGLYMTRKQKKTVGAYLSRRAPLILCGKGNEFRHKFSNPETLPFYMMQLDIYGNVKQMHQLHRCQNIWYKQ